MGSVLPIGSDIGTLDPQLVAPPGELVMEPLGNGALLEGIDHWGRALRL